MRRFRGSLLIVGALIASGSAATAQDSVRVVAGGGRAPLAVSASRSIVVEDATITARLDEAARMAMEGQLDLAKRTLQAVIRDERRAKAYPARSLRQLASIQLMLDRPLQAAATLEDLAREAAKVDDDETELVASVDAAVLYVQQRQRARAQDLMPRIRRLLDSPRIAAETRQVIATQIAW